MATDDDNDTTVPATITPEHWITHPVSDHGDLDRPEPAYADSLSGEAKAEYDAAVAARSSHVASQTKPKPKRRKRRGKKN